MLPDRRKIIVFSPPPKLPPMQRRQPYRLMNPLTGVWPACRDAIGYRYVSPYGDEGRNNQHLGARNISATTPPRWEDYGHTVFTTPPPQCAGATTTLHSPLSTLNSPCFNEQQHVHQGDEVGAGTGVEHTLHPDVQDDQQSEREIEDVLFADAVIEGI